MANVLKKRGLFILQFSNRLYRCNQLQVTLFRRFYRKPANYTRGYDSQFGWLALAGVFATGVGTIYLLDVKPSQIKAPFLLSAASKDEEVVEVKTGLTLKQIRFEEYASYECGGKRLMSPKDFLDSLVDNKRGKPLSSYRNCDKTSIKKWESDIKLHGSHGRDCLSEDHS